VDPHALRKEVQNSGLEDQRHAKRSGGGGKSVLHRLLRTSSSWKVVSCKPLHRYVLPPLSSLDVSMAMIWDDLELSNVCVLSVLVGD
jgi:hypothetical protein